MELDKIIEGCKRSERLSQKLLFERHAGLFYAVSKRYTPASLDPMDNLHDAFIKIFEHIKDFDPQKGHFESWGRKIVINNALQQIKKKSFHNEIYSDNQIDSANEDLHPIDKLSLDELYQKIEKLPEGYRQVFCLYEIEGYSHKEIGEMLGIQEVSSRSNLCRSKKLLKDMLSLDMKAQYQSKPA